MKNCLTFLLIAITCFTAHANIDYWQKVSKENIPATVKQNVFPDRGIIYALQLSTLKTQLWALSENPKEAVELMIPVPDGSFRKFNVWQDPMMEAGLATKYPGIKTFTAVASDNKAVTAKLDITLLGFHAMIYDGDNTFYIDPYSNPESGYYYCFYKRDHQQIKDQRCGFAIDKKNGLIDEEPINLIRERDHGPQLKTNGSVKRTYRLAMACTGEYSVAVAGSSTPTKAISLSAITTSVNRVNGVFEKELSIHMNIIAKTDTLIFTDAATDSFHYNTSAYNLKDENKTVTNKLIGTANYDIGHVFSTGVNLGDGAAELECVCNNADKAGGATGRPNPTTDAFDIDFVIHEMGHQYGATHTFNANTGSCTNNVTPLTAYEPGSGSSIMGYAGICSAINDLQPHSDDYFHAASLDQISDFITDASKGAMCSANSSTGNNAPTAPSFTTNYNVPYLTPFELISPQAVDADHDVITYNWEEWDLGDFRKDFNDTRVFGPIFRSFKQTESQTRVFPTLNKLRDCITNYLGEKLPDTARTLKFTLTIRDIYNGYGCFYRPSDLITLNVVNSSGPFILTYPNLKTDYWQVGSSQTVTWDVANTTAAPVNAANVDIFLSLDDGVTYPYQLAANTPNDGSEVITVPMNAYTASARVKVKGAGNVFFDISNTGFIINNWPANVNTVNADNGVSIYPVPAKGVLNIDVPNGDKYDVTVTNTLGQQIISFKTDKHTTVSTDSWAEGMYNLQFVNTNTNEKWSKRVVVE
ncbi:MAG: zinc-dependent metalloprotease [Bacteroidetes bacterium]|nr:zinc-dependent metalloprotease [Bacteroidota bacterium]